MTRHINGFRHERSFDRTCDRYRRIQGFTLVEVLVSLFVLGAGVMGAAAMQLTALRTAQQSAYQTAASHLAAEMADRMRANRPTQSVDDHDDPYLKIDFRSQPETASAPASASTCYAIACGAKELAAADIRDWIARLDQALPDARVKVCRDVAPWHGASQRYTWNCSVGSGAANAAVVIKIGWQRKGNKADGTAATEVIADVSPNLVMAVAARFR